MCDVHGATDSFVQQEGNCGPRIAKIIAKYPVNEEVVPMQCLALSPTLKTFENLWVLM